MESDSLPVEDRYFDAVLCTQVLEHVKNVDMINELIRVIKPGGTLVLSVPFIYNEHGSPHDYRRYTYHGLREIFLKLGWKIVDIRKQGACGSTLALLLLNWCDMQLNSNRLLRTFKGFILPIFVAISLIINLIGLILDKLDTTGNFYNNVILIAHKPCESH